MSRIPKHEVIYAIEYECGKCGAVSSFEARVPPESELSDIQGRLNIAMNRCKEQAHREGWASYGTIQVVCPECISQFAKRKEGK